MPTKKPSGYKKDALRDGLKQLDPNHDEANVVRVYIKGLNLTHGGAVDIPTKEKVDLTDGKHAWFEFKQGSDTDTGVMFAQLLHYAKRAYDEGQDLPAFLVAADAGKASMVPTDRVRSLFDDASVEWHTGAASSIPSEIADNIGREVEKHWVTYHMPRDASAFTQMYKDARGSRALIRTRITPENVYEVYGIWQDEIGQHLRGDETGKSCPEDYFQMFFLGDIFMDKPQGAARLEGARVTITYAGDQIRFSQDGESYKYNREPYDAFWRRFDRPPQERNRFTLLSRRDVLLPKADRAMKGAFYTPEAAVHVAHAMLGRCLGADWMEQYTMWDMAAGVGNLAAGHRHPDNIFLSTLDQDDVDLIQLTGVCRGARVFQYDYLNDDVQVMADGGASLVYRKMDGALQDRIARGKEILPFLNPPYGEPTAGLTRPDVNTRSAADTHVKAAMGKDRASSELFAQFLWRIRRELLDPFPGKKIRLAIFSKLKIWLGPSFEDFRRNWHATLLGGFISPANTFDTKGNFPVAFQIWELDNSLPAWGERAFTLEVYDRIPKSDPLALEKVGEKTFAPVEKSRVLNAWIDRPKSNGQFAIPLKNAVKPCTTMPWVSTWSDGAIGYMLCSVNDLQNAGQKTALFSSAYFHGHGFYVTEANLAKAAVTFTVRRLIRPTWINDRDQFAIPHQSPSAGGGYEGDAAWAEFEMDCLVWMLFSGSNLTATADLEYQGATYHITNHFLPYTARAVGVERELESDFMVRFLAKQDLSREARALLDAGKQLWQCYFQHVDRMPRGILDDLCLRDDQGYVFPGYYQARRAFDKAADSKQGAHRLVVDTSFVNAPWERLTAKLEPQVYGYGFLTR